MSTTRRRYRVESPPATPAGLDHLSHVELDEIIQDWPTDRDDPDAGRAWLDRVVRGLARKLIMGREAA
jgi:hypothetical protein